MGFRDKNSYDDMGRADGNRRRGGDRMDSKSLRIIVSVVIVGIILCIGVVVLWLLYFSTSEPVVANQSTNLIVEPIEAEQTVVQPPASAQNTTTEPSAQTLSRTTDTTIETPTPNRPVTQSQTSQSVWYVEHEVGEDESLESISEAYEVSRETILSVNAIKNLSSIKAGVVLRIPNRDGQLYTVQSGDSLSIITNRFNPTLGWKTLQELNGLKSEVIYPGQKIFIPSARVDDDGSLASYDRFIRPSDGRITGLYGQTVVYGTSEEIVVLQGIWVEGKAGSPVNASATGVVVDAGNVPDGMGRFIVMSHENGYKTTYAHLDQIIVKVGDQIKQGEPVGYMGSTGSIGKTSLYFSIEQDGTALNPANFF